MNNNLKELKCFAANIRKMILEATCNAKSGHPGGSLSAADILAYLYHTENLGQELGWWCGILKSVYVNTQKEARNRYGVTAVYPDAYRSRVSYVEGWMTIGKNVVEENAPRFTAFATTEQRLNWHLNVEQRHMYAYYVNSMMVGYYCILMVCLIRILGMRLINRK